MISDVDLYESKWAKPPWKFEAGTPSIADGVALNTAIQYLEKLGMENIQKHEEELTKYTLNKLKTINNIKTYGPKTTQNRSGIISFNIKNINHHDLANYLNENHNIHIRSGHHCAQPLMKKLGVKGTARISLYIYNIKEDIDTLHEAILNLTK